jgi:hypothetical protein
VQCCVQGLDNAIGVLKHWVGREASNLSCIVVESRDNPICWRATSILSCLIRRQDKAKRWIAVLDELGVSRSNDLDYIIVVRAVQSKSQAWTKMLLVVRKSAHDLEGKHFWQRGLVNVIESRWLSRGRN